MSGGSGGGAAQSELRAHDARHDDDAQRARLDRRRVRPSREARQHAVLGGAEVGAQLALLRAARERRFDLAVTPGEAIVRRDVITR